MSNQNNGRPEGWHEIELQDTASDVANSFVDGDWVEARWIGGGNIRLIQTGNIGIGRFEPKEDNKRFINQSSFNQLRCKSVYGGDILICRLADPIGRACIVPNEVEPCITSVDVTIFRPDPKRLDRNFAVHLLNFEKQLRRTADLAGGTTRQRISRTNLGGIDLVVPQDPAEQRRIAEILDTADEAIQKTEALIAKLKQMKAGLLHDLLTRGIDENGELRPKNGEKQRLPVGEAPAEWVVEECERLCHSITVGIVVRPTQYYTTTGVPVLRSTNVTPNGINGSDLVFMSEESNLKMAKSMVRTGDVVTIRTGYPGTSCVVCERYDRSNCVDILISRPTKELLPEFLAMWINSDFGKGQVLRQQTGLAQQHFNVGELKELLIAKPTPEEQRRIIDRMNAAKNRIDDENEALEKLKLVKAGLMNDLLTGKKRVIHSGPASV